MTPDPITGWAIAPSAALFIGCVLALAVWGLVALARATVASFRRAHNTIAAAQADVAHTEQDTP